MLYLTEHCNFMIWKTDIYYPHDVETLHSRIKAASDTITHLCFMPELLLQIWYYFALFVDSIHVVRLTPCCWLIIHISICLYVLHHLYTVFTTWRCECSYSTILFQCIFVSWSYSYIINYTVTMYHLPDHEKHTVISCFVVCLYAT
jgi:hypothetical protein